MKTEGLIQIRNCFIIPSFFTDKKTNLSLFTYKWLLSVPHYYHTQSFDGKWICTVYKSNMILIKNYLNPHFV